MIACCIVLWCVVWSADSSHAAADGSFSSRRELCFTLEGDIFVRYQSYQVACHSSHSSLVVKWLFSRQHSSLSVLLVLRLHTLLLYAASCCMQPQKVNPALLGAAKDCCTDFVWWVVATVICVVQSAADLAADLTRKVPTKIDIGPVYTHDPRQRAKYAKGESGSRHCTNMQPMQFACLVQPSFDMSQFATLMA
jgi:hypothetical protein